MRTKRRHSQDVTTKRRHSPGVNQKTSLSTRANYRMSLLKRSDQGLSLLRPDDKRIFSLICWTFLIILFSLAIYIYKFFSFFFLFSFGTTVTGWPQWSLSSKVVIQNCTSRWTLIHKAVWERLESLVAKVYPDDNRSALLQKHLSVTALLHKHFSGKVFLLCGENFHFYETCCRLQNAWPKGT